MIVNQWCNRFFVVKVHHLIKLVSRDYEQVLGNTSKIPIYHSSSTRSIDNNRTSAISHDTIGNMIILIKFLY